MLPSEREKLADSFTESLRNAGCEVDKSIFALIQRVFMIDTAHLDALGENTTGGRPVILADAAEGFDLLLLEHSGLSGSTAEFDRIRTEHFVAQSEMAFVRKIVGAALQNMRQQRLNAGFGDACLEWESDDGARYLAIPSDTRESILQSFGVKSSQVMVGDLEAEVA